MSDLTAKVSKDAKGSITVDGYEALKYHFHYTSPVFALEHEKLASLYKRWGRVLVVMDKSELVCELHVCTCDSRLAECAAMSSWAVAW
jgi:hypothetical protein